MEINYEEIAKNEETGEERKVTYSPEGLLLHIENMPITSSLVIAERHGLNIRQWLQYIDKEEMDKFRIPCENLSRQQMEDIALCCLTLACYKNKSTTVDMSEDEILEMHSSLQKILCSNALLRYFNIEFKYLTEIENPYDIDELNKKIATSDRAQHLCRQEMDRLRKEYGV